MIVSNLNQVKELYAEAAERGWVLPCFCSENLTTTEAILSAAAAYGKETGREDVPITLAITCRYDHRSQAHYYTRTGDCDVGLKLFFRDIEALTEPGAPFEKLRVLVHLDHIQYDSDEALTKSDLSRYSSIMYDASALPLADNIRLTAQFVEAKGKEIYVEGACDEIVDATGSQHNDITTPEAAERYFRETGVDMIVANLGTEHRASGKELTYHGDAARAIREKIGHKIVLHGTSSVTNDQVRSLFSDGVCKVNIWTALERDSTPLLLEEMVRRACENAGSATVQRLIDEGLLGAAANTGKSPALPYFAMAYRNDIIFDKMKSIVEDYLRLWYV